MQLRRTALLAVTLSVSLSACGLSVAKVGHPPSAPTGAHRGGVLRVGVTAPGGIDPLNAYEPVGKLISTALCDTLVSLDPTHSVQDKSCFDANGDLMSSAFSPDGTLSVIWTINNLSSLRCGTATERDIWYARSR